MLPAPPGVTILSRRAISQLRLDLIPFHPILEHRLSVMQPPPPVNRKLEQSFNDSLCVDPFQSRADITTVYIDDREYDEDVIDFARAKKNAFDIVRRSRSNLFMKGPLKGGLSSSSEVKRAQHYVDNTLATVDITNDASMMS